MEDETPGSAAPGQSAGGYGDLPGVHITANQLVARNMAYFRKVTGLTQEDLGEMLGWSAAVVSAAERSWEAKRVRQFTVDDVVAIAGALNLPVAALLLPLEDDGISARYLMDIPGAAAAEPAENTCWDMHTLMGYVMSEPSEDDSPAPERYRERYVSALNLYFGADHAAGMAEYMKDLSTEDRVKVYLDRLRSQYDALREILADNDHLQSVLLERLYLARTARRSWGPRHDPDVTDADRELDEKIGSLVTEMFGSADAKLTRRQMERVVAEAGKRGFFRQADDGEPGDRERQ